MANLLAISIVYAQLPDIPLNEDWTQIGTDISGQNTGENFGESMSLNADGNTITLGSWRHSSGGLTNRGVGRVYDWNANNASWEQRGNDILGDNAFDYLGRSVDISADGNTIVIGGNRYSNSRGITKVYKWDSNTSIWVQRGNSILGELGGSGPEGNGFSVSISDDGNTIATGSLGNDSNNLSNNGATRIFDWDNTNLDWIQRGTKIIGETANENSGETISLSADGNSIAIGAPSYDNGSLLNIGVTRIYEWDGSNWVKRGQSINGEVQNEESGESLDLNANGEVVIIGSPKYSDDIGAARVYYWNDNTSNWSQLGNDFIGTEAGGQHGHGVSISNSGKTIAIGSPFYDSNNIGDNGITQIYDWSENNEIWVQRSNNISGQTSNELSGSSISLNANGNKIAVNALLFQSGTGTNRIYNSPASLSILENANSTLVADTEIINGDWTHYYNGTTYLLGIKKNNQDIGSIGDGSLSVSITNTTDYNSGNGKDLSASSLSGSNNWYAMNRYWEITTNSQPTNNVTVLYPYHTNDYLDLKGSSETDQSIPEITDHSDLLFYKVQGNPHSTTETSGNFFTNSNTASTTTWEYHNYNENIHFAEFITSSFSGGSGSSNFNNILPIKLTEFKASKKNNDVELTWETASEINNKGFEIQYSTDAENWQNIDFVSGAGDSQSIINYKYIHHNPSTGSNFYRLRQIDYDGQETYSQIRSVIFEISQVLRIYPNPTTDKLYINSHQIINNLILYDINGNTIDVKLVDNMIDTSRLPTGTYILKIVFEKEEIFEKFIVQ